MDKEIVFTVGFPDENDDSCGISYYVNSYNGQRVDSNGIETERLERKYNVRVCPTILNTNLFHKYEVCALEDAVCLNVWEGHIEKVAVWKKVYTVKASLSHTGIEEEGECDIEFWHEYFATNLGNKDYNESAIPIFDANDSMRELRKVFIMELAPNPFIFFEKYKTLKKYSVRKFDTSIFDIPMQKIPYTVGKVHDGKFINYVVQHEIEIDGEVFYDLKVLSGDVSDGIIKPQETHRIFLTSNYWYSPDGGDIGVLVQQNTYGIIYSKKMGERHPELMLDRYRGKFKYAYFLSRNFVPCFEILAKAGYDFIADVMLETYFHCFENTDYKGMYWKKDFCYKNKPNHEPINIWGKNDKEIFGFKLSKFRSFSPDVFSACYETTYYPGGKKVGVVNFSTFIKGIRLIIKNNEALLDRYRNIGGDFFNFILFSPDISFKTVEYMYEKGFENARLYIDYVNMCRQTNRWSGGLYPNNIKHEHDVMAAYMSQLRQMQKNVFFVERVQSERYLSLLYDGDKDDCYCILAPRKAADLAEEGLRLHHCVEGYIGMVVNGVTSIYFLREKKQKGKPMVTIEVRNNSRICQARGSCNRSLTPKEMDFVIKWSRAKGLLFI